MSGPLVFMMGTFAAEIPIDRMYAKNHMWAMNAGTVHRFGFTAYAVRLLQDVYFLDWNIDTPCHLAARQEIGNIESKKAESALYAPAAGELLRFNPDLMKDPSAINLDKYAGGWLFEMKLAEPLLLSPHEYLDHLTAVWEITQRTIKGQLND
ncbi:MAG: glycine cleavage system protein H [Planctomycetes bacterium]|nr:glycine cleavage system protein H [Planctomycetota bacterium]